MKIRIGKGEVDNGQGRRMEEKQRMRGTRRQGIGGMEDWGC